LLRLLRRRRFAQGYFEDTLRKGFVAFLRDAKIVLGCGPRIPSGAIFISSLRENAGPSTPLRFAQDDRGGDGATGFGVLWFPTLPRKAAEGWGTGHLWDIIPSQKSRNAGPSTALRCAQDDRGGDGAPGFGVLWFPTLPRKTAEGWARGICGISSLREKNLNAGPSTALRFAQDDRCGDGATGRTFPWHAMTRFQGGERGCAGRQARESDAW
jgi:hypothetical protein